MSTFQKYNIPCGDHNFEFTLSQEEAGIIRNRRVKSIQNVVCPTCKTARKLDVQELIRLRVAMEASVTPAAFEEAKVEVLAKVDGDEKRFDLRELRKVTEEKVATAVLALGNAEVPIEAAPEKSCAAEWNNTSERGSVRKKETPPPLAPDATGVIDSTGEKQ